MRISNRDSEVLIIVRIFEFLFRQVEKYVIFV